MQAMPRYSQIIITLFYVLFIVYSESKFINEAKPKITNGKTLIDRLDGNGANFMDKVDRYVRRLNERGLIDDTGFVHIAMGVKQLEKLIEKGMKAMNAMNESYAGGKIAQSMNEETSYKSRRRLPVYWSDYDVDMYNEWNDDEGILDDWIDSLSNNEAIYYYNLLSGVYDESDEYDEYYDEYYEEEEDSHVLNEMTKKCGATCNLENPYGGLRKIKCEQPTCSIKCKKDACGSDNSGEYIKPKQGTKDISFECEDECKGAVVLMTGTRAGMNLQKVKSDPNVKATFSCASNPSKSCSPKVVAFYNLKEAEITGCKYPEISQINFRNIDHASIVIPGASVPAACKSGVSFKDVSIYTQKVGSMTIDVNQDGSFTEILLDVRGVDGAVKINCNNKGSCNKLVVRYQKSRCKKRETIEVTCAMGACQSLEFIHESFNDKFGGLPKFCWGKTQTVIPKIKMHPMAALTDVKIKTLNKATPPSQCTNTTVWYDPHAKRNEGHYILATEATTPPATPTWTVCVKLTKNKEYNAHTQRKINRNIENKGKNVKRTTGKLGQEIRKGVNTAGVALGVAGGIVGTAAAATVAGPIVGVIMGSFGAVLPMGFEAIHNLVLLHKNRHLGKFVIKWEDSNTHRFFNKEAYT